MTEILFWIPSVDVQPRVSQQNGLNANGSVLIFQRRRLLWYECVLEKEVGLFGPVIHRTDIPKRGEKLPNYRTHKHTLYGKQEGLCNGCQNAVSPLEI